MTGGGFARSGQLRPRRLFDVREDLAGRIARVEEDLARHEVPHHDDERGAYLHDEVVDAQKLHARPHAAVVEAQADNRQHDEDGELAPAAHALLMGEHVAHRRRVVEHDRGRERNGGADEVVHAERLGEQGK